jgi:predicted RNA-binding protein (TIGR00451 family)
VIRDTAVDAISHGARLGIPGILSVSGNLVKGDPVAIMSQKGEMVAIGKALLSAEEIRRLGRGLAVAPYRVVMRRGTYPKLWKTKPAVKNLKAG